MNSSVQPSPSPTTLNSIARHLVEVEKHVYHLILNALADGASSLNPGSCDKIFGIYTCQYLTPCENIGLTSRAARFAREQLVPAVLQLEKKLSVRFHKGALFYDTGIAHLLAGDEYGFEYFLAMTDEEEVHKTGGVHRRGSMNLRSGGLAAQTITRRMQFSCDLLNGRIAGHVADFAFITGEELVTTSQLDSWRQTLEPLHQFELLRVVHGLEVFLGDQYPPYPSCADNPFVLLRLAKALSHLAQWVESCLTDWQAAAGPGKTLSSKLRGDPDFGASLSATAGGAEYFAGHSPHGAAVDAKLGQLLTDLTVAPVGAERQWRLLRILYIVRNSTAHTIEPNLAMYRDRALLLNLIQAVFVSAFAICQLKAKQMP